MFNLNDQAAQTARARAHVAEFPCTADIGVSDAEREKARGRDVSGNQLQRMVAFGPGFECYGPEIKRFGRPEVLKAIEDVAAEWAKRYPSGPRLGVGNISFEQGGPMEPHTSHQEGVDVDFAPISGTDAEMALTWTSPEYSRERTQELVDLLQANTQAQVSIILFNDPNVKNVDFWDGHDNHLHVRFIASDVGTVAIDASSDSQGSLRLVAPNMRGNRVQKLQDDLVKISIFLEKADGIFGGKTDAAVREFQMRFGLAPDGIAGTNTLGLLKEIRSQMAAAQAAAGTTPLTPLTLKLILSQGLSIDFADIKTSDFSRHPELCREVQVKLQAIGLLSNAGTAKAADGKFGPQTQAAIRQFKVNSQLTATDTFDAATAKAMVESKPSSALLLKWEGGDRDATVQAIKQEANRQGITNKDQIAYIIATVEHETAGSFEPVREGYYLGEPEAENYRRTLIEYYPYYGRGYVQLTWNYNYRTYSNLTGLDLINNPDLAMRPDVALFVIVHGMKNGTFSKHGYSLDYFTSDDGFDFVGARQTVNNTDKASDIAAIAQSWTANLA
jgi:peptidoglycan hydrolase-like protein with peptidoglycan-binding domain